MIKLLHLADLHIGMENYGRVEAATGLHSRLTDYLDRFDEAIDLGIAEDVDAVLIAGDIYKNRTPNPTHQREFARRLGRIQRAGLPVIVITGNHDIAPAIGRAHSIEIFDTLKIEGVTVIDRAHRTIVKTKRGEFQLIALPWVTRHTLLTREELRLAGLVEIEAMIQQRVERFLEAAAKELDPNLPAVLMAHGSVDGATLGSEQQILLGRDQVWPRSLLGQPGIDYVAMGHIHKHQVVGNHPPIVYPGSIERIDFGEEREPKGCVIVELAREATTWRFHPLKARAFVTVDVDVRDAPDPQAKVLAAIDRQTLTDTVVRVRIEANPAELPLINVEEVRRHVGEAGVHHVAAVAVNVERRARGRLGDAGSELLDGITPRRALELYLSSKQTPAARMAALLAAADEIMEDGAGAG